METLYRKVAVTVKAVQFTDRNKDSVYNWAKSIQANVWHDYDEMGWPALKIPTLEGDMLCSLGDYLIVEPFPTDWRKLYPCKPSIFNQTYELLDAETPDPNAQLKADKAELLEALERVKSLEQLICLGGAVEEQWVSEALALDNMMTEIESLIQKHKQ